MAENNTEILLKLGELSGMIQANGQQLENINRQLQDLHTDGSQQWAKMSNLEVEIARVKAHLESRPSYKTLWIAFGGAFSVVGILFTIYEIAIRGG